MEDYKFLFKVVLVGNAGVGKTCLVRRFTQGLFPPGQGATIGVDFMIKTVEVDGEKVKVSRFPLYQHLGLPCCIILGPKNTIFGVTFEHMFQDFCLFIVRC